MELMTFVTDAGGYGCNAEQSCREISRIALNQETLGRFWGRNLDSLETRKFA